MDPASQAPNQDMAAEIVRKAMEPIDGVLLPAGDPARHRDRDEIHAALRALHPPVDRGTVALLVARSPNDHARSTPAKVRLAPGDPLPGDRWDPANKHGDANQLTLMNVDVARVFCNGQALTLPGDNLLVDLDLGHDNLPTGSLLAVGSAVLEITAKAHNGCKQFVQRFGKPSMLATVDAEFAGRRLRGVHARVVTAGDVAVGDAIVVRRRGEGA